MNYRHAFHAGNFADLHKHAVLLALLDALTADPSPLHVIDTHAGAGTYDLGGDMSRRSGEAAAGIGRLMAATEAPPAFATLRAAVRAANAGGTGPLYPGSPVLIARALRPGDRYDACELRPDDHASLKRDLSRHGFARALCEDGYEVAATVAGRGGRVLVLIDPPFERPDDPARIVATTRAVLARDRAAVLAIWLPLKDLETLDAFLRSLESATRAILVAEVRLRPLTDPMKMNGCAMVLIGAPAVAEPPIAAAGRWIVEQLGEPGGQARLWRANPG